MNKLSIGLHLLICDLQDYSDAHSTAVPYDINFTNRVRSYVSETSEPLLIRVEPTTKDLTPSLANLRKYIVSKGACVVLLIPNEIPYNEFVRLSSICDSVKGSHPYATYPSELNNKDNSLAALLALFEKTK